MSTTITFAGNLTDDPHAAYTREGKLFVTGRVLVNRRSPNAQGVWVDEEPTAHNIRVHGAAAANVADSFVRGDRVIVHGELRTETWNDKETGEKRTKNVVEVNDRFGEIGASVKWAGVRIEPATQGGPAAQTARPTATAV